MPPTTTTSVSAARVALIQTGLSLLAFTSALAVGCKLHYLKIVKNGVAGYPQEWLPSVSATIGDWYPERNLFQFIIALTAAPRFTVLFLTYHLHASTSMLVFGVLRTLMCAGWMFVTSSDSGMVHDVCMIAYIVLNVPWMGACTLMSRGRGVRRTRLSIAVSFFATIIPLVYFYIQHKVHKIPGAYSTYAIFEWSLIFLDIAFDSVAQKEFREQGVYITLGGKVPSSTEISAEKAKHEEVLEKSDSALKDALHAALDPAHPQPQATSAVKGHNCSFVSFISDVYRSYVFWSLFTALIPTLFYFSIWELGIAGAEFALFALLTPAFLNTTPFFLPSSSPSTSTAAKSDDTAPIVLPTWFEMLRTRKGQVYASLASYVGLLAFISPSPPVRLGVVTVAVGVMMQREVMLWAGAVEGEDGGKRGTWYWSVVTVVGFAVGSTVKGINHGNNPIWPFIDPKNGGWNKTGLALALLSLLEFALRAPATPQQPASRKNAPGSSISATTTNPTPSFLRTFLTTSLPLGSLVFSLHNLVADPSTLVAASWTGWANGAPKGPSPHLHWPLTIAELCSGIALGIATSRPSSSSSKGVGTAILQSWIWWALGAWGFWGVYALRDWRGYGAGLGVAFWIGSVAVPVLVKAAEGTTTTGGGKGRVGAVYASAMGVYIVLNLASIFTVAYAFVPGGWVFRERTDAIFIAQLLFLAPAFSWPGLPSSQPPGTQASTPDQPTSSSQAPKSINSTASRTRKYTYALLALLTSLAIASSQRAARLAPAPVPYKQHVFNASGKRMFNAGIWTVHFGFDNEGHDSQRGVREVVRDMELDVVGLLETDLHRTAFGHRDLTRVIVEDLGYYVDIGPGPNSHTWGAVLLSKFPIIESKHHLLPSPAGELAPAIEAVLDVFGEEVTVVVAHNGQEEDKLDRELQSTELARIMAASTRPVFFLGYVVTKPHAKRPNPYEIMVTDGNVHDIDDADRDRWCEYIFYRGLYRTSYARLSRGIITDTELQIGQFVVPRLPDSSTPLSLGDLTPEEKAKREEEGRKALSGIDDSKKVRYRRSRKEKLPKEHWFPMEYYGKKGKGGKNGHYYHVFGTPLYYLLPEGAEV